MSDEPGSGVAARERRRAANNALGLCLVALFFLAETIVAHHAAPSPYSPMIWFVLGATALAALIRYLLLVRKLGVGSWGGSR
jgi:hypothetical protein